MSSLKTRWKIGGKCRTGKNRMNTDETWLNLRWCLVKTGRKFEETWWKPGEQAVKSNPKHWWHAPNAKTRWQFPFKKFLKEMCIVSHCVVLADEKQSLHSWPIATRKNTFCLSGNDNDQFGGGRASPKISILEAGPKRLHARDRWNVEVWFVSTFSTDFCSDFT